MKYIQTTSIESNNVKDLDRIYELYYELKRKFEEEEIQTLKVKITVEVEAI